MNEHLNRPRMTVQERRNLLFAALLVGAIALVTLTVCLLLV